MKILDTAWALIAPKSPKLAKEQLIFCQGLQNLDLHECGFVCADIHVNIIVYQPAFSVEGNGAISKSNLLKGVSGSDFLVVGEVFLEYDIYRHEVVYLRGREVVEKFVKYRFDCVEALQFWSLT